MGAQINGFGEKKKLGSYDTYDEALSKRVKAEKYLLSNLSTEVLVEAGVDLEKVEVLLNGKNK